MAASMQFSLLDLPDEIITLIVEHVHDRATLQHLARTCHRLQDIAEGKLYRTGLIRSRSSANKLQQSFNSRSERAKALQVLDVPCDNRRRQDFDCIAWILNSARNLRELMFESPACNTNDNDSFEDAAGWTRMSDPVLSAFREACSTSVGGLMSEKPLQRLRKLTLHMNGPRSPYWTLDSQSINIFLHPTLRELKISCMNILHDLQIDDQHHHTTPLKTLVLEECNISHLGIARILSLPKGLETLYLGENCHNIGHFDRDLVPTGSNNLFQNRADQAIEALRNQKHTLKALTYVTTAFYVQPPGNSLAANSSRTFAIDGGFSDFLKLEDVTLVGHCPAFERCLMSGSSPPNLKRLANRTDRPFLSPFGTNDGPDSDQSPVARIPFLRAPSASPPKSLKSVDITFTSNDGVPRIELMIPDTIERSLIEAVAAEGPKLGISIQIFITERGERTWYYPPYLYGEKEPEDCLLFKDGFVGSFHEDQLMQIAAIREYIRIRRGIGQS